MDVVALGELLIDFTVAGPPRESWRTIRGSAGGAPANVLAMIARLGGSARFIGKVGQDPFGDYLQATLQDAAIDTSGLLRDTQPTTLAFVNITEGGERSFTFQREASADTMLRPEEIADEWFANAKVFHFGSLSLTDDPARSATWQALRCARRAGCIVSFDPNLRKPLWSSLDEAKSQMLAGIREADIIKLSDEELTFLTDCGQIADGLAALRKQNDHALFLVTLGERGSIYATTNFSGSVPPVRVQAVDTTAAGDAFFGAFLYGLTRDWPLTGGTVVLEQDMLVKLTHFASAAGALTTTRLGAFSALPTLEEVQAILSAGA